MPTMLAINQHFC